jgi:hypothetical protein
MPVASGANSRAISNPSTGVIPAMLRTYEKQTAAPILFRFDIIAREGSLTDTTIANYSLRGLNSSVLRTLLTQGDARLPESGKFLKGELTTRFESVTPKTLNLDVILRADRDQLPGQIKKKIAELQSLCYPRVAAIFNPPLCTLQIANLYNLEGYVTQVLVNWHNTWHMRSGMPMGADINLGFLMHQYPTMEEVRAGAGFDSGLIAGTGFSGTPQAAGLADQQALLSLSEVFGVGTVLTEE